MSSDIQQGQSHVLVGLAGIVAMLCAFHSAWTNWFPIQCQCNDWRLLESSQEGLAMSRSTLPYGETSSERKFNVKVVSMPPEESPSDKSRSQRFNQMWSLAWPNQTIDTVTALFLPTRGMGLTTTFINAMTTAMNDPEPFDYLVLFEDDAKPFDNTKWPDDLNAVLDRAEERNAGLIMLGAHKLQTARPNVGNAVTRVYYAWGTYAWAMPHDYVACIYRKYRMDLAESAFAYSPDIVYWEMLNSEYDPQNACSGRPGFVATPLLVDHPKGWSETWKTEISEDNWMGKREWWTATEWHWIECCIPLAVFVLVTLLCSLIVACLYLQNGLSTYYRANGRLSLNALTNFHYNDLVMTVVGFVLLYLYVL